MEGKYGKPTLITSRITIDYEKDTVDIEKPEHSREEGRFISEIFFGIILFLPFYLTLLIILPLLSFLLYLLYSSYIWFIIGFSPLYLPICIYLLYYNKRDVIFEFFAKQQYKGQVFSDGRWRTEVTELDEPIYEIALFHNIYLGYNTEGEFSNYLRRIEIREQTFIKESFSRFRHKKKEREGIGYWKATFYFSDIPKTGKLAVWFI